MTTANDPAARAALAPTGRLRAGLNFSNFLLTRKEPGTGYPAGIAVDLARELGKRLGVSVDFLGYPQPGPMADAAGTNVWDIAFLGAEPARANVIDFTAAYVQIEATYLVPPGSALKSIDDVDRNGVRISVSDKSAYELYLSRAIKNAELVRVNGVQASFDKFAADKLEALAGLRPRLVTDVKAMPGSRILEGRFTAIQQAIGAPKGRNAAGAAYLRAFVEEVKASGLVARLIEQNGVVGLSVAARAA